VAHGPIADKHCPARLSYYTGCCSKLRYCDFKALLDGPQERPRWVWRKESLYRTRVRAPNHQTCGESLYRPSNPPPQSPAAEISHIAKTQYLITRNSFNYNPKGKCIQSQQKQCLVRERLQGPHQSCTQAKRSFLKNKRDIREISRATINKIKKLPVSCWKLTMHWHIYTEHQSTIVLRTDIHLRHEQKQDVYENRREDAATSPTLLYCD